MVCAQDGQLHIGDKLVSVNGVSLKGVTHSMALQLLKKPMELVSFVVLREGLQTQGKIASTSNKSKAESSVSNSPIVQDRGVQNEPPLPLKTDNEDKLQRVEQRTDRVESQQDSTIESQEDNESKHYGKSLDPPSVSSEDETAQDQAPELPCSPPPSPLLGVDDILDSDVSIPPPSFSPPPPPIPAEVTSFSEDEFSITSIPIVSPPPDLSPRMKKFIEEDLFDTDDRDETDSQESTRHEEIPKDSSSKINKASSTPKEAVVAWDFQSLLEACNDLNTTENDDVIASEQSSVTEAPLVPVESKAILSSPRLSDLPSQTKISKKNDLEKVNEPRFVDPVESGAGTPSLAVGRFNNFSPDRSGRKVVTQGPNDRDKDLQTPVKEHNVTEDLTTLKPPTSPLHSKGSTGHEIGDVKPVAGRRVENVPFVITYQKKFRSLGMKVDLSEEGKVIVTEVSSFGLVGKDGNIRYELCKMKLANNDGKF